MKAVILTVEGAVPSWNVFYAGTSHWKRTKLKNEWHMRVREALDPNAEMFDTCVDITIFAFYKDHPKDSDNICDKLLIDPLKGLLIQDDGIAWVRDVCTRASKSNNDYAIIHISEIDTEDVPTIRQATQAGD